MEQATNSFGKGLQLDTNPMVQGTDTLTDCLNGTMLTMQGNEVILQNDMGNRRVNNAFLPSGYQPVGMKEYGGIIYIAAYNPITNKSQIGSFPSPQRKIDSEIDNPIRLDLNKFSNDSITDEYLGIRVLSSDSFMIPLTKDNYLRAGDKFAIYSSNLYRTDNPYWCKKNLTNFNNIEEESKKAYSPKNKMYTLSVGILNSQNEFVDITKTLCRWKDGEIIYYDDSYSDIYKFNDGYFIFKNFSNEELKETQDDSKLIKLRQKIATNTYAYKLVGPMYLKATLNHIENFNYNIYGIYKDGIATLWIEGYLTYNCPDGVTKYEKNGDENFYTYEEGKPSFSGFELINAKTFQHYNPIQEETIIEKAIYNPNTNTYSVKIVKKYENIVASTESSTLFEYILGVNSGISYESENIYIKGLSVKDTIDLDLFGSGQLRLKGWQFYNIVDSRLVLSFIFDAYPEYGDRFRDLTMEFSELGTNNKAYEFYSEEIFNGKYTTEIYFGSNDEMNFEQNKVYRVTITYKTDKLLEQNSNADPLYIYDIYSEQDKDSLYLKILPDSSDPEIENTTSPLDSLDPDKEIIASSSYYNIDTSRNRKSDRWVLTTKLFNEFYNSPEVLDYCTTNNEDFTNKMTALLSARCLVTNLSGEKINRSSQGSLYSINKDIEYKVTNSYNIKYQNNPESKFFIKNETLYPFGINSGDTDNLQIEDAHSKPNITNIGIINNNQSEYITDFDCYPDIEEEIDSETYNATVTYYDIFKGRSEEEIKDVENIFCSLTDSMNNGDGITPLYDGITRQFCGVAVEFNKVRSGGYDIHFAHFINNNLPIHCNNYNNPTEGLSDNEIPSNGKRIAGEYKDGIKIYSINELSATIFNEMDKYCDKMMFTYLAVPWNRYRPNVLGDATRWDWGTGDVVRVWWKSTQGWAYFFDVLCSQYNIDISKRVSSTDLYNLVLNVSKEIEERAGKYIYNIYPDKAAFKNSITNSLNLYATNKNCSYNCKYEFVVDTTIKYKRTKDIDFYVPKIGNLVFNVKLENGWESSKFSSITLDSSDSFQENIKSFNPDSISNVFKDGRIFDSEGNKLSPNSVYELIDNQLVKVTDKKFYVAEGKGNKGQNLLYYAGQTPGCPTWRWNVLGDGVGSDPATAIDFNNVNMVPK